MTSSISQQGGQTRRRENPPRQRSLWNEAEMERARSTSIAISGPAGRAVDGGEKSGRREGTPATMPPKTVPPPPVVEAVATTLSARLSKRHSAFADGRGSRAAGSGAHVRAAETAERRAARSSCRPGTDWTRGAVAT